MSWQLRVLNGWLRWVEKPYLARETDYARARARLERQAKLLPMSRGMQSSQAPLIWREAIIPALRLTGPAAGPVVFWLHGGAYCLGSPATHAAMVAALARRIGGGAVLPAYRLAPEHVFPAAPEDALAGYRALLAEGCDPSRLVLGGDSAGGGLAFGLLHRILEEGLPAPACALAFSPWADLTLSGASLGDLAARDVLLPAGRIAEMRDIYLGGADPRDPRASPVFGTFPGAPPVLIQASLAEILRDDARAMAAALDATGGSVTLDLWDSTPHVWQFYQGRVPEAGAALDRAARFIHAQIGNDNARAR